MTEAQTFEAPASFAQVRLWFVDQLHPRSTAYNVPAAFHLPGTVTRAMAEKILNRVVERHEVLRTVFEGRPDGVFQVVLPEMSVSVGRSDLSDLDDRGFAEKTDLLLAEESRRPFDLAKGPLMRAHVVQGATGAQLLTTMHHIVCDGWSIGVLRREIEEIHQALVQGEPDTLEPLPVQYVDYVAWQLGEHDGWQSQLEYWKRQLDGAPDLLGLPTDHPRPPVAELRGATQMFEVPKNVAQRLIDVASVAGATPFMVLLAAFKILLHRYSGMDDIVVATPTAGRTEEQIEGLVGCFLNNLVLRSDLSENPRFYEFLTSVRDTTLDAYANQEIPLELIVNSLDLKRSLSHNALFQVMFAFQNFEMPELESEAEGIPAIDAISGTPVIVQRGTSKFDLSLSMTSMGGSFRGAIEYSTALFSDERVMRMITHLQVLLTGIAQDARARIDDFPLLTARERTELVDRWNATDVPYDETPVHLLFEKQVRASPDRVAAVFESERVSYAELNARANRVAHELIRRGVGPETVVGVCLSRSMDLLVSLLAVLKSGGAYVALEPAYPRDRLEYLVGDSDARVVVTTRAHQGLFEETAVDLLCVDSPAMDATEQSDAQLRNPSVPVTRASLAYVMYTSGSTGRPKGVAIEHGAITDRLWWMVDEYAITPDDRFLQKHAFSFDVSVWELFLPLMTGGRTVLISPAGERDHSYLIERLATEKVTFCCFLPSLLKVVLDDLQPGQLPSLRVVLCGAEVMTSDVPPRFYRVLPEARLDNLYGPTETCIHVTWWPCTSEHLVTIPIGRPMGCSRVYILDARGEPVPIGVPGEVYIGGSAVARGYVGNPDETKKKFLDDPWSPGSRMYRTGDFAQFRPDGAIEFIGRQDDQVKVRGFRVELGEVQRVLAEQDAVRDVIVVPRESAGGTQLVAYFVGACKATPDSVRDHAGELLPDYMIPSAIVKLDEIPFTKNDKVDYGALPNPASAESTFDTDPPRGETETVLHEIWAEILDRSDFGTRQNFFQLGGQSILAAQMTARIKSRLGVRVSVRSVFDSPTISGLARAVEVAPQARSSGIQRVDRGVEGAAR